MLKVMFFGDIVGKPGRVALRQRLPELVAVHAADLVIANGENAAGGLGLDPATAAEIFAAGVELITSGNHIWKKKEASALLEAEAKRLIRPANFPAGAPGKGYCCHQLPGGEKLVVINLQGRVFMSDLIDCPFQCVERLLGEAEVKTAQHVIVDFHAEATSEKVAMARFLDGRVSAVFGTHTHVQTADEQILPGGTAYISDVGMCGPADGVIGVDASEVIKRFLSARPTKYELAKGAVQINFVVLTLGPDKALIRYRETIDLS